MSKSEDSLTTQDEQTTERRDGLHCVYGQCKGLPCHPGCSFTMTVAPTCSLLTGGEVSDAKTSDVWKPRVVIVPREPTEAMLIAARDWSAHKYGKPIGDDAARGCWTAMLESAEATA